jgi:hypothetical protein
MERGHKLVRIVNYIQNQELKLHKPFLSELISVGTLLNIMTVKKWRYIGGHLYRLAEVFISGHDAVLLARTMKETRCVVISKTPDNRWAVYWRARATTPSQEELPYTIA